MDWEGITQIYRVMMPTILAASEEGGRGRIDPYFYPWCFTPIEEIAWHSIRYWCLPVYPQVPVHGVFIDFANPFYKIGLELDGKEFHDPNKDYARDVRLMREGWKIFRIPGSACVTPYLTRCELESLHLSGDEMTAAMAYWFCGTADGVIAALDQVFFRPRPEARPFIDLALRTLDAHRLAPFPLPQIRGTWTNPDEDDDPDEDAAD